ncbi:type IV secretion system protein VirB10 [Aquabacterium sp. CECT 9606]|uniref:type IV secretion system protein VirB10 n=1 Tax=Aquabacterium sp. CECT 9606 TaxID=2845822 RepID=UPI001E4F68EB|nr:type IV secretion system protein VirB10 [Aquabacterium sp. CECT 9606]CAH0356071.1 hypothetical protein AQB9606_04534 [Aquabacterium sp. CECT 9606]
MEQNKHTQHGEAPDSQLNSQLDSQLNTQPGGEPTGIVSVNSRGGTSDNMAAKVMFVVVAFAILVIGGLIGYNKWRDSKKAEEKFVEQTAKGENKPAAVGPRRTFDSDPPPLPSGASSPAMAAADTEASFTCADKMPGKIMLGPDHKPMMAPSGVPMRVCTDGTVLVPAVKQDGTIGGQAGQAGQVNAAAGAAQPRTVTQNGTPAPSRYSGEVIVGSSSGGPQGGQGALNPSDPMTQMAMIQSIMNRNQQPQGGIMGGPAMGGGAQGAPGQQPTNAQANPPGSIGSMLTPSQTPMISASMIGDRNMLLPKGRTIDCGLSMRLVNEVAGMASCVVSQNVYSDNGRVLLLERGSEASGEYVAAMAQGQRRLFVLWTRIKTPQGVVINLNSPGADALGTSGLDGYVDNHWWERLGAAFLLSMVQDAIAFETAKSTPPGGTNVYQNTSSTGNRMAEKVLESTINIKPTLYKNQGDRSSIYVARDLDFGTVYALRAR